MKIYIFTLFVAIGVVRMGFSISPKADNELFKQIPKVELHLHLGGSYPLEYMLSIADSAQKQDLENELKRLEKSVPYQECFAIFGIVSKIVNTEEKVERGVEALCKSLAEDGVVYAEIRTGIKDLGKGYEEYLKAVLRGIQKGSSDRILVRLLLSLQRSSSLESAQLTSDLALKYQPEGIVGIDISGDSTIGEILPILPVIQELKTHGLNITLHIGESPNEKGQIDLLKALRPDRVGHGVFLEKEAEEWLLEHETPLEICLSSSVAVQMIDKVLSHPGLTYYAHEHPISICTDDPLIFQTSSSREYRLFSEAASLDREDLRILSLKSIDYSFLSEEDKALLKVRIEGNKEL